MKKYLNSSCSLILLLLSALCLLSAQAQNDQPEEPKYKINIDGKDEICKSKDELKKLILKKIDEYKAIIKEKEELAKKRFNPTWKIAEKQAKDYTDLKDKLEKSNYERTSYFGHCVECNGTGEVPGKQYGEKTCPKCVGTGRVSPGLLSIFVTPAYYAGYGDGQIGCDQCNGTGKDLGWFYGKKTCDQCNGVRKKRIPVAVFPVKDLLQ